MFLKILKYWAGGLIIFLFVIFIIPETSNFIDTTIFIDIPLKKNDNIKNSIYLYNKNPKILKEKLYLYLNKHKNEKISIVVPRLEYLVYYFFFTSILKKTYIVYELNSKTTKINPQLIVFYYHKTLIKFFQTAYDYIYDYISNLKGK